MNEKDWSVKKVAAKNWRPLNEGENRNASERFLEYLRMLASLRTQHEKKGEYIEAKKVHWQIRRLLLEEESRQRQEWLGRHEIEKREAEKAHDLQVKTFSEEWLAFMSNQKALKAATLQAIKNRHAEELALLMPSECEEQGGHTMEEPSFCPASCSPTLSRSSFTSNSLSSSVSTSDNSSTASVPSKASREILDWRRKERSMVQQHRYVEAEKLKQQAESLERKEKRRLKQVHASELSRGAKKMKMKQNAELRALCVRLSTKQARYEKQMREDYRRLVQRNQNAMTLLAKSQRAEASAALASISRELEKIFVTGADKTT
jgi:hypothetical protein